MTKFTCFIFFVLNLCFCLSSDGKVISTEGSKKSESPPSVGKIISKPASSGVLLEGKASGLAIDAVKDYTTSGPIPKSRFLKIPGYGAKYYDNLLGGSLKEKATVGQVNRALKKIDGRISSMTSKEVLVTIIVPAQESVEALKKLADSLNSSGAFESVAPTILIVPN